MLRGLWLLLVVAVAGRAHEPITTKLTWTREIARIVNRRCISCHREGGVAPMSLLSYEEARPWAKAIKEEVLERRMPPWGPVKGFGEFRDDRSLSDVEITWLAEWVEGGAPKGEEIYLPRAPGPPAEPSAAPPAEKLPVRGAVTLARNIVALGIEPSGPLAATAYRPDGVAVPLVWLRLQTPHQPRVYYFREPLRLPRGTRIQVASEGDPTLTLLVAAP